MRSIFSLWNRVGTRLRIVIRMTISFVLLEGILYFWNARWSVKTWEVSDAVVFGFTFCVMMSVLIASWYFIDVMAWWERRKREKFRCLVFDVMNVDLCWREKCIHKHSCNYYKLISSSYTQKT